MAVNLKNINELPEKVELTGEERVIVSDNGVAKSVPVSEFAKKDDGWDIIVTVKSESEEINVRSDDDPWWVNYYPVLELKCQYEEVKQRFIEEAKIPKLLLLRQNDDGDIVAAGHIDFIAIEYMSEDDETSYPFPVVDKETNTVNYCWGEQIEFASYDINIFVGLNADGQVFVSNNWW